MTTEELGLAMLEASRNGTLHDAMKVTVREFEKEGNDPPIVELRMLLDECAVQVEYISNCTVHYGMNRDGRIDSITDINGNELWNPTKQAWRLSMRPTYRLG